MTGPVTITSNGGGDTAIIYVIEDSFLPVITKVEATGGANPYSVSIVGGADAGAFQFYEALYVTGLIRLAVVTDFEHPGDADHNNTYIVVVRASDGVSFDDQTITVVITPHFVGTAGNDTFTSTSVDDLIDGNGGDDTVIFSRNLADYSIQDLGSTFGTTTIKVSSVDGNDTLHSISHLRFADGTINVADGSGLFDTIFYDRNNLDVFHAGANALNHFNTTGWHEGRDPDAFFSTSFYLGANPDVRASGANPLDHYHQTGWKEGRDPGPNFDTKLYLIHNPDVAAAGIDPLEHYLQHGIPEGRQAYAAIGTAVNGFDAEYYLIHNPDVAAAGVDPLTHFNASGWHEGRNPNAYFDTAGYLAHYADVAAAGINPLTHYEQFGWKEGRDPSAAFDTLGYLAANPDVAAAHLNPLDHFLNNGIYEGRTAINDGVWH
jgi:hypothetical protein